MFELGLLGQRHIDEVEAGGTVDAHLGLALQGRDLLGNEVEGGVDVAAAKGQELGRAVAEVADHHALEGRGAAPVVRVAHELDLGVALPRREAIGPRAGRILVEPGRRLVVVLGAGAGVPAVRLDELPLEHHELRCRNDGEERLVRLLEQDVEGVGIDDLDTVDVRHILRGLVLEVEHADRTTI